MPPSGETNQRLLGFVSGPPNSWLQGCKPEGTHTFPIDPLPKAIHQSHCGRLPARLSHSSAYDLGPVTSPFGISPSPSRTSKIFQSHLGLISRLCSSDPSPISQSPAAARHVGDHLFWPSSGWLHCLWMQSHPSVALP